MSIFLLISGFVLINTTQLLINPFHDKSPATFYIIALNIGYLIHKAWFLLFRMDISLKTRCNILPVLVAIVTYGVILRTKENAILGIVGFCMHGHVGITTLVRTLRALGL